MAIKTILFDKKVISKDGVISIYAPYDKLFTSYKKYFRDSEMWAVGFALAALDNHKQVWCNGQTPDILEDEGLKCCKIFKSEMDFSVLDREDYFFVAPKMKEWKEIWFHGLKSGTKYKQWWCKGIHDGCCYRHEDQEITAYLDEKKNPFNWRNYVEGDRNVIFPRTNGLLGNDEMNHDYSQLSLTPEELHEGSRKEADVTGQTLF